MCLDKEIEVDSFGLTNSLPVLRVRTPCSVFFFKVFILDQALNNLFLTGCDTPPWVARQAPEIRLSALFGCQHSGSFFCSKRLFSRWAPNIQRSSLPPIPRKLRSFYAKTARGSRRLVPRRDTGPAQRPPPQAQQASKAERPFARYSWHVAALAPGLHCELLRRRITTPSKTVTI